MAIHSNVPAAIIPWIEEPGGLQSMGLQESDMTDAHTPDIFYYLFAAVIAIKSYAVLTTLLTPSIVPDTS